MTLLHHHFYPLLQCAGLPHIRFHDLRHTAATLLLGKAVNPTIVSAMWGHVSRGIELDTDCYVRSCPPYSHWQRCRWSLS